MIFVIEIEVVHKITTEMVLPSQIITRDHIMLIRLVTSDVTLITVLRSKYVGEDTINTVILICKF